MPHSIDSMIELLRQHRIGPGDRVAARLPNCQLLIDLIFACWKIGANICPMHLRIPLPQIEPCLNRLQPKLYLSEDGICPREALPSPIFSSIFLFTSGSTGIPKIGVLSRENLLINAQGVVDYIGLESSDRWLLSLPLFHVGGLGILFRCFLAKAKVVLDPHDPEITHLSFVPTMLYRATPIYKQLRCLMLGGAPIHKVPPKLPICLTYGLTEMSSLVTAHCNVSEENLSLGHPLPHREMKLSSQGEVLVKGACLFQGYWENGQVERPEQNGWFPTGDLGHYSEKTGLVITGRKDWLFISGGENIQPEEIERALLTCPEIQEAAVVPRPDPEFGFRPVAFVRTTVSDFSYEKMRVHLMDFLPKYKIPVALHQLEEFPRKGLKIDRQQLLKLV